MPLLEISKKHTVWIGLGFVAFGGDCFDSASSSNCICCNSVRVFGKVTFDGIDKFALDSGFGVFVLDGINTFVFD